MFPSQFANICLTYQTFVTNLHLLGVELHCKLQKKLHRVTEPLINIGLIKYVSADTTIPAGGKSLSLKVNKTLSR